MTRVAGMVASGYERVRDAFAEGHAGDPGGAQLCVLRRGETVVDLWIRPTVSRDDDFGPDSLTVVFSATKGALALCAAILIDRGELDVEARVARYWPEFAANGKERATVTHLLGHTVGLPAFPASSIRRIEDLADRDRLVRELAAAPPLWEPGTKRGPYQAYTFGYLVGEVIRRITGVTEGRFFADNVARPLGLDFWIGLPPEFEPRVWARAEWGPQPTASTFASWRGSGVDVDDPLVPALLADDALNDVEVAYLNTPAGRAPEIPSLNGVANARSIARMYGAMIGMVDGVRLISRETLDFVRASRVRRLPVPAVLVPLGRGFDRGLGFWLSDPHGGEYPMAGAIGHPGSGGVLAFAQPERGLAVGYTCTSMSAEFTADPRNAWVHELEGAAGD